MKKRTPDRFWFPWWPDKWIFGSVRIECTLEERAIWVDLLSLASKDDGHIRANEDTPYPIDQLAGMLVVIPPKKLKDAIDKFVKLGKLTREKNRTLYVTKWEKYQFSARHKRRVNGEMSDNSDTTSKKEAPILKKKILNNKKEKNIKKENKHQEKLNEQFEKWFKRYPRKDDKGKAKEKWLSLVVGKKVDPQEIEDALTGYINILNNELTEETYVKHAKTFLYNGNKEKKIESTWRPFIKYSDPKYKKRPSL